MNADALFALLRRRGFLWPTAEIYGGAQGLYDYGPLGAALKRNITDAWRAWFVGLSEDYYLIDPAEILPEAVVRASGHLEHFTDPEVTCEKCRQTFRADTVLEKVRPEGVDGLSSEVIAKLITDHAVRCPNCGASQLAVPRPFNMMFGLDLGVTGRERGYLRPETAQSSFLAFSRMWDVGRRALPLGVAVVGKAFRNEIAPRQVLFRMREFTQAELQIFFDPETFPVPMDGVRDLELPVVRAARRLEGHDEVEFARAADLVTDGGLPDFYVYHLAHAYRFMQEVLGYPKDQLRLLEKSQEERAFYNRIQFDVEANVPTLGGFRELGAVHYRGDYDLSRHAEASGKDLSVLRPDGRRVTPHVLELTFGPDRNIWALADLGLREEGERTVWRIPAYLAPVPVAIFPLLRKEHGLFARELWHQFRAAGLWASYDDGGAIGRRYARMDEVGTPYCVTVDGETIDVHSPQAGTVTLRERDSKAQRRLLVDAAIDAVQAALRPAIPPLGG